MEKFVITAVNKLTGQREEISRPMTEEEAAARLDREKLARAKQKYFTHNRLRVEKRLPVQLSLDFESA